MTLVPRKRFDHVQGGRRLLRRDGVAERARFVDAQAVDQTVFRTIPGQPIYDSDNVRDHLRNLVVRSRAVTQGKCGSV